MQATAPADTWIRRSLKALVLWGYGWRRRKQRDGASWRVEWRNPATGQWHGEKNAVRLLKAELLACYPPPSSGTGGYRAYF